MTINSSNEGNFPKNIENQSVPTPAAESLAFFGLDPSAPVALRDVRTIYREKASRVHPDQGGTHDEMARLNHHYSVIREFLGAGKNGTRDRFNHTRDMVQKLLDAGQENMDNFMQNELPSTADETLAASQNYADSMPPEETEDLDESVEQMSRALENKLSSLAVELQQLLLTGTEEELERFLKKYLNAEDFDQLTGSFRQQLKDKNIEELKAFLKKSVKSEVLVDIAASLPDHGPSARKRAQKALDSNERAAKMADPLFDAFKFMITQEGGYTGYNNTSEMFGGNSQLNEREKEFVMTRYIDYLFTDNSRSPKEQDEAIKLFLKTFLAMDLGDSVNADVIANLQNIFDQSVTFSGEHEDLKDLKRRFSQASLEVKSKVDESMPVIYENAVVFNSDTAKHFMKKMNEYQILNKNKKVAENVVE